MKSGMIALSMVLVISAVLVAVLTTVTYLAVGEGQAALSQSLGENNLAVVEGCVEDALQEFHDSATYVGGSITRPEGTCTVTVNSGSPNYDVIVTAVVGDYSRKIQIKFTRGTNITISSWQEI